jgi:hypothetical protein
MHRIYLVCPILFLILASPALGQAQKNLLKNGGFETFAGDDPSGWETTNIPKLCVVVSPSTRRVAGQYAAKCEVKDCFGSNIPGMITQKKIPASGTTMDLKFSYVLKSVGGDVGYVSMVYKNNEGSTIRMCEEQLSTGATQFAEFTATFPVPEDAETCELKVALLATTEEGSLHVGSSLIVDDMSLVVPVENNQ